MAKRSSITICVMKLLYPNKICRLHELKLTEKQIKQLFCDRRKFGGFNSSNDDNGRLEYIWLSSEGKRYISEYIARHNYLERIKLFLKGNYQWIITTIVAAAAVILPFLLKNH